VSACADCPIGTVTLSQDPLICELCPPGIMHPLQLCVLPVLMDTSPHAMERALAVFVQQENIQRSIQQNVLLAQLEVTQILMGVHIA
jgi:hypothetical protein